MFVSNKNKLARWPQTIFYFIFYTYIISNEDLFNRLSIISWHWYSHVTCKRRIEIFTRAPMATDNFLFHFFIYIISLRSLFNRPSRLVNTYWCSHVNDGAFPIMCQQRIVKVSIEHWWHRWPKTIFISFFNI